MLEEKQFCKTFKSILTFLNGKTKKTVSLYSPIHLFTYSTIQLFNYSTKIKPKKIAANAYFKCYQCITCIGPMHRSSSANG